MSQILLIVGLVRTLTKRQHSVLIEGKQPPPMPIAWGVPQGSVVGHEMILVYSIRIEDVTGKYNMFIAHRNLLYVVTKLVDCQYVLLLRNDSMMFVRLI